MARKPRAPREDEFRLGDDEPVFDRNGGTNFGDGVVDPNQIGNSGDAATGGNGDGQTGEAPKKRRRRTKEELAAAGEGGGKSSKANDLFITADHIAGALMLANNFLAGQFGTPAFFLEQKEAAVLAPPVKAVLKHYGYDKIAAKYGVWGNLFLALGMVYGPKAQVAFGLAKAAEMTHDARQWNSRPSAESMALMRALSAA